MSPTSPASPTSIGAVDPGSIDSRQAALAGLARAFGRLGPSGSTGVQGDEVARRTLEQGQGGGEGSADPDRVQDHVSENGEALHRGKGSRIRGPGQGDDIRDDRRRRRRIEDDLSDDSLSEGSPFGSRNKVGGRRASAPAVSPLDGFGAEDSGEDGLVVSEENKAKAAQMGETLSKIMEQATRRRASEGNIEKTRRCFLTWKGKALYSSKARRYKLAAKRLERQMAALEAHMQRVALAQLRKNAGKNEQVAFGSKPAEKEKGTPAEDLEPLESIRRPPPQRQARQPVAFGSRPEPKLDQSVDRSPETAGPDLDGGNLWRSAAPATPLPGQKPSPPAGSRDRRPAGAVRRVRTPPVKATSSLVRSSIVSPVKAVTAQGPQQQVASLKLDLNLPCDHLTSTRQRAMDRHVSAERRRQSVVGPLVTGVALPRIQPGLRGLMQSPNTMSAPSLTVGKRTL